MEIFGITIDFSFWVWFFNLPTFTAAAVVFALGGWVFLASFFIKFIAEEWREYRVEKFKKNWQWVLLAVDIPPLFVQTPKAVEQIFAHLSGALAGANVYEKYWKGKAQKPFSFEVISIEGYIQFLIRTELEFRDLIEASIYAQYPDAEITEVEDYISNIPDIYPNSEYDVAGVEFKLSQDASFPIRTYRDFEYSLSKEAVFSDPMAATLENFTRIGSGENLWMQIIIEPLGSKWKESGIGLAKEIMKTGSAAKKKAPGLFDTFSGGVAGIFSGIFNELMNIVKWSFEGAAKEEKKERVDITPGIRKTVEAIEEKISKIGFKTKLRVLYAGRKEVFNPSHCISGFIGAINQFNMQDRNAIVPFGSTSAKYDSSGKKTRALKNGFVKVFKGRTMKWKLCDGYTMNIEELATLWHFPLPFVKTPLLRKAEHKRAEPPSGLPVEKKESPLKPKVSPPGGAEPEKPLPEPPSDLPFA